MALYIFLSLVAVSNICAFTTLSMFAIHLSSCFYFFLSNHSPPQLPVFLLFSAIFAHLRYVFLSSRFSMHILKSVQKIISILLLFFGCGLSVLHSTSPPWYL